MAKKSVTNTTGKVSRKWAHGMRVLRWQCAPVSPMWQSTEDYVSILLVAVCTALAYLGCAADSIAAGDSGDIVVSAVTGSTPHPPGYPLVSIFYGTTVWMASRFAPTVPPTFICSLTSGVLGSAASCMLFLACRRVSDNAPSVLFTCLYSWGRHIWSYSIVPEVFALNNFFVCGALLFVAHNMTRPHGFTVASLRAGALLFGLAMCNQHTIVLMILPLASMIALFVPKDLRTPSRIAQYVVFALVGLLPYSYTVISCIRLRGQTTEMLSWGDCCSASGLLRHFLRSEYGTFNLISSLEGSGFVSNLAFFGITFAEDSGWVLLAFPLVVLKARLLRSVEFQNAKLLDAALVVFLSYVAFFCWRCNIPLDVPLLRGVVARFTMQPFACLALLGAAGLHASVAHRSKLLRFGVFVIAAAILIGVAMKRAPKVCMRGVRLTDQYTRALLEPLPQSAVLLAKGDLTCYPTRAAQTVQGLRKDVLVLDQETMGFPWYTDRIRRLYSNRLKLPSPPLVRLRPVGQDAFPLSKVLALNKEKTLFVGGAKDGDTSWEAKHDMLPVGATHKMVRRTQVLPQDPVQYMNESLHSIRLLREVRNSLPNQHYADTWEAMLREEAWATSHRIALSLLTRAGSFPTNHKASLEWRKAALAVFVEVFNDPLHFPSWQFYKNAGICAEAVWSAWRMQGLPAAGAAGRLTVRFFNRYQACATGRDCGTETGSLHSAQDRDFGSAREALQQIFKKARDDVNGVGATGPERDAQEIAMTSELSRYTFLHAPEENSKDASINGKQSYSTSGEFFENDRAMDSRLQKQLKAARQGSRKLSDEDRARLEALEKRLEM